MMKVSNPSPTLSVVIPVYNQRHLTERCLNSLLSHSTALKDIWVIDNASQDGTHELLIDFKNKFSTQGIQLNIVANPKNVGYGRACNQGVRGFLKGNNPYLAILNNDTWLMPGWDQVLIETLKKHRLSCVGPYFYEGEFTASIEQQAKEFVSKNRGKLRNHFAPMLIMLRRSAVEALSKDCSGSNRGIFDERFFVTYEDTDLLKRMKLLNLNFAQTGSCFIWHLSQGTRAHTQLPNDYEQQGYRLFYEKWGYDPRPHQDSIFERLRRKYWKILEKYGRF